MVQKLKVRKNKISRSHTIFYVHGLGATPSYFDKLVKTKYLKHYNHFVFRSRQFCTLRSIEYQSDVLFGEFKDCISSNNYKLNKIVFVGHSQGGLVALELIKKILNCDILKNQVNIKGLFTIGTPWCGVPLVLTGEKYKIIPKENKGVTDLSPNSKFYTSLNKYLKNISTKNKKFNFTICPVAGKISTLTHFKISIIMKVIKPIIKIINFFLKTQFISNEVLDQLFFYLIHEKHDCIVTVKSQLGKYVIPSNLLYKNEDLVIDKLKHDFVENMIPENSVIFKGKIASKIRKYLIGVLKKEKPELENMKTIIILNDFCSNIFKE